MRCVQHGSGIENIDSLELYSMNWGETSFFVEGVQLKFEMDNIY